MLSRVETYSIEFSMVGGCCVSDGKEGYTGARVTLGKGERIKQLLHMVMVWMVEMVLAESRSSVFRLTYG